MKAVRRLALRREALAELTTDELAHLGGAVGPPTPVVFTLPLDRCFVIASVDCITYKPPCPETT